MHEHEVRVLVPLTYMNRSGQAVAAMANYFHIPEHRILIAHDEVAFEPGTSRLKVGGGTNGHKGLTDIIRCLGNKDGFARLRIGVGHPGDANLMTRFLTHAKISASEREAIARSLDWGDELLRLVLAGKWQHAMSKYHSGTPAAIQADPS